MFGVAAALALVFLVWGSLATENFSTSAAAMLAWITANLGWLFVLSSAAFVLFSVFLAVTRYGNIKLGGGTTPCPSSAPSRGSR